MIECEHIQATDMHVFLERQSVARETRWTAQAQAGLWFGVITSGILETRHEALGSQIWDSETFHAFWSRDPFETEHVLKDDQPLSAVFVHIPEPAVPSFLGESENARLKSLDTYPLARPGGPISQAIAWRMLGCSLTGAQRRLYLASRAFDLMSCLMDRCDGEKPAPPGACSLSPEDIERIHCAESLLVKELKAPPTGPELAAQVGMNARKLNAGFSRLFGMTIYAYVKHKRLEMARALLEIGGMPVSQVAYTVGYDPAHFSHVFRRHFGHAPSQYGAREDVFSLPTASKT